MISTRLLSSSQVAAWNVAPQINIPAAVQTFFGTFPPDPITHQGVFYYLGGATAWANPHTSGKVTVTQSTDQGGGSTPSALVDRANTLVSHVVHTQGVANSWVRVDLNAGRTLKLSAMSIAVRGDYNGYFFGASAGTVLQIDGSNDGITWIRLADIPNTSIIKTQGAWSELTINATQTYSRYRITHLGLNTGTTTHFVVGELELYGELT